jgi:hypothetical protein
MLGQGEAISNAGPRDIAKVAKARDVQEANAITYQTAIGGVRQGDLSLVCSRLQRGFCEVDPVGWTVPRLG